MFSQCLLRPRRRFLAASLSLMVLPCCVAAQVPETAEGPLKMDARVAAPRAPAAPLVDNDTIVRMFKAGLGDDLLVQTIQLQPGRYETGPDSLIGLKQAGLSDRVISAMQAHGTGLSVRREARAGGEPPPPPMAPPPDGVEEIGVYYKDPAGRWQLMESEIVHVKSGGFLKNTLSDGIIKTDRNGVVSGREAKLLLARPVEFLIHTPDGVDGAEYDVLRFRLNSKDREFRTLTGGVIHSTGGAQRDELPFKPTKIGPRSYTFTLSKDTPGGEYGVLPPGTGNVTNGGKIYTFGISE